MKKTIFAVVLLLAMTLATFAEQRGVFMEFHRKSHPQKNMEVNRAPMRLPIEAIFDSETLKIEVVGNASIDAEVYLYNKANDTLENYSSSLNSVFTVSASGTYIVQLQGEDWYAEGEVEI